MFSSDDGSSADTIPRNTLAAVDGNGIEISQVVKKNPTRREPRSSKSTLESLTDILALCNASDDVEFAVPESDDRADHPPEGFFTLYEAYFRTCFLWFPIPSAILEFLWRNQLAISQITPRGMRCLVGIMIRSYECGCRLEVNHLLSLLTIKKTGSKDRLLYFIDGKVDLQVIRDFPLTERSWEKRFFFARINSASVGSDNLSRLRTRWGICGFSCADKFPADLFDLHADFIAEKCSWKRDFSLRRVKNALVQHFGALFLNSPLKMSCTGKKLSARERRAAEARADTSAQVPQRIRPSPPVSRPGPTATPAPRSRRPELERSVPAVAERRLDDTRKKGDVVESGRKRVRGDSEKNLGAGDSTRPKHSGPLPKPKDLLNSSAVAASHLSKILSPGAEFPPPLEMSKKDAYSSMALHCMTFLSSLNSLAIDYEVTARSQNRKLANLQRACDENKRQRREAEDTVAALGAAVKEKEDKHREINVTFTESESERKLLKRKVSDLTSRLNDAAKLQETAVQRAVDQAKREMAVEYESRIGRAREKLRTINDQPRVDIIDLAQVQSNIEFVELLQSDEAPALSDELDALKKQEAGLLSANETFAKHVSELEAILGASGYGRRISDVPGLACEGAASDSGSSDSSDDESSSDTAVEIPSEQVVGVVDDAS